MKEQYQPLSTLHLFIRFCNVLFAQDHLQIFFNSQAAFGYNNKKMREDLSVIAQHTRLGNITVKSLEKSLSQFRKEINSFKEKNKIYYSDRVNDSISNRALLANALESTIDTSTQDGQNELKRLTKYKCKISELDNLDSQLREIKQEIKEISFSSGKNTIQRTNGGNL